MTAPAGKILLIDDDADIHGVVELMLTPLGHRLTCCRTGASGLEAMRRERPDLVLLDIMLTDPMEGLQVACQMRQDPRLKDIPIIFISAVGELESAQYAKEICPVALAADMFLEKPLVAASVREAVAWVLQQQGRTQAPPPPADTTPPPPP